MTKKNKFYVQFYDDKDKFFGFSYSDKNDFKEDPDFDNGVKIDSAKKIVFNSHTGEESKFATRFVDFTDSMKGYSEFLRIYIEAGSYISGEIGKMSLEKYLEENGVLLEEKNKFKIFEMSESKKRRLLEIRDILRSGKDIERKIPQIILMGLVSIYENHLALLARIVIESNPGIIGNKEKYISFEDANRFDSMAELKSYFIDKEIENVFREGADKQIEWFEQKANISDIKKNHKNINDLLEIFQRRNVYAHNNGIVNDIYLSNMKKIGASLDGISNGDILSVSSEYFKRSFLLLIEFGVKIIIITWRKTVPSEAPQADASLLNACYEMLINGEYELALLLAEFALDLRGERKENFRMMFIVNKAIALKLTGQKKKCSDMLDKEDWSACGHNFQCCVAAVREDIAKTVEYMKKIGKTGEITENDYQEWPAFYGVREEVEFKETFRKIFGREYTGSKIRRNGLLGSLRPNITESRPRKFNKLQPDTENSLH